MWPSLLQTSPPKLIQVRYLADIVGPHRDGLMLHRCALGHPKQRTRNAISLHSTKSNSGCGRAHITMGLRVCKLGLTHSHLHAGKDNGAARAQEQTCSAAPEQGAADGVAMSLSKVPDQASAEAPRQARLTRRATLATSAAVAGKRSAAEAACAGQQLDGPAPAGAGRAKGAGMAQMPDEAAVDCPGPAPSQKRRKTTASRLAGVPEQEATADAPAIPEQPPPALDTIVESDTEEGGDRPSLQVKAAAIETAAPAALGSLSHGVQGQAPARDQAARAAATGHATEGKAPAFSNGLLQPHSQHQSSGSSAEKGRPEGVGAGKQDRKPARRSMRRCTMAARPGSALRQAGRPGSALSPVLEHSLAASGAFLLSPTHVMRDMCWAFCSQLQQSVHV